MKPDNLSPLDSLKKAVIDQKKAFLPQEAAHPGLKNLHQAVNAYDQLVSQLVIGTLQGWQSEVTRSQIEESRKQIDLQLDMPSLRETSALETRLNYYRTYTARLDRMLELVEQVRSESDEHRKDTDHD